MSTEAPDDFEQHIKRQVLDAYGFDSEAELDAAIEEELPGYLAAEAERKAREEAYAAELPGRLEEAAAVVTAWGQAHGMLPDGIELVPIDLQADAQWMASAPPQFTGLLAATDGEYVGPAAGPPWRAIRTALDFERQSAILTQAPGSTTVELSVLVENFTAAMSRAADSIQELARALRLEPWPHGWNEPCFCHPKPFPAARDYRRRTKHRNRRRKP